MRVEEIPTYIITVKYGKELKAELEIGDSIFEADPEVKIRRSAYGGLLTVYTKLTHKKFLKHLLKYPPSTVERVVRVDFCCSPDDYMSCILREVSVRKLSFREIRLGRHAFLGQKGSRELIKALGALTDSMAEKVLYVEPIDDIICFSLMKEGEDKIVREARKRLIEVFFQLNAGES